MPLHVSSTCAHHQEVKIALHNLWYYHTETSEWSKFTKIQYYKYEQIVVKFMCEFFGCYYCLLLIISMLCHVEVIFMLMFMVFYSSTIIMMHGPINIRFTVSRFYSLSVRRSNEWLLLLNKGASVLVANMPINVTLLLLSGNRGSKVVKVLCYKSEGRWFDPSWWH